MLQVPRHRDTEVAQNWRCQFLGRPELLRHMNYSSVIQFFSGGRVSQLALFKVGEDGVVFNGEQDVVGFDICYSQ